MSLGLLGDQLWGSEARWPPHHMIRVLYQRSGVDPRLVAQGQLRKTCLRRARVWLERDLRLQSRVHRSREVCLPWACEGIWWLCHRWRIWNRHSSCRQRFHQTAMTTSIVLPPPLPPSSTMKSVLATRGANSTWRQASQTQQRCSYLRLWFLW